MMEERLRFTCWVPPEKTTQHLFVIHKIYLPTNTYIVETSFVLRRVVPQGEQCIFER